MSGATLYIKRDLKISDVEIEILVGTINVFSLIGSALAGRTSDWVGRRYTMVLAAVIFFVGAILMGLAPNYSCLMGGRFVAGVGMGFALMISPVYAAEVAPASTRGFLTSFTEVFVNFGMYFGLFIQLPFYFIFSKYKIKLAFFFLIKKINFILSWSRDSCKRY